MKKFLTTLLCIVMIMAMMPMATGVAFAEESYISIGTDENGSIDINTTTSTDYYEYDSVNKILTLKPSITNLCSDPDNYNSKSFIRAEMDELTIKLAGDITLETIMEEEYVGINFYKKQ